MPVPLGGRIHGSSIELDAPIPSLEGKRVLVVVEPAEDVQLSSHEQRTAWEEWARRSEQGPIEQDGEPEFP